MKGHQNGLTFKEAFLHSPGPNSVQSAFVLALKGVCMGSADIVPGVSGGTIALITGIYQDLLTAIKSFDSEFILKLVSLDIKGALAHIHLRFLIALLCGIGTAIFSLARVINYALKVYPELTWSLFFGLIAASILVVGKKVSQWNAGTIMSFVAGGICGYLIVGLVPVQTPESLWFVFISGFVAICAMILPGISGAFILLILGKYEYITGTLKNPFNLSNLIVIGVFCAGCISGLCGFSRILNYLLNKWYSLTLAFLTGLMAGCMKKIWPWKQIVETKMIQGKVYVLQTRNILPENFDNQVVFAISLMIIGLVFVVMLEWLTRDRVTVSQ